MPWKEATKMSQRSELIAKWERQLFSVAELAEEFGISRPTAYLWIDRYRRDGASGLEDRPTIPNSCPHRTPEAIRQQIIEAKRRHPNWGPAKLVDLLRLEQPDTAWPAASTAGDILKGEGLVASRRPRRRGVVLTRQGLQATESGEMMTADHKGQFRMMNGQYCFPVTINDPVSRFIYAIDGKSSTSYREARSSFERVFRTHGIPAYIGTDNGVPFSCPNAIAGLSSMSVWWIRLGITPVRIHPGCPWENGVHERMHRTLKAETTRPPGANQREQQKMFNRFRTEFNTVRPHEGLNGKRPVDILKQCATPYPRRLPQIEYPAHYETRVVRRNGVIKWQNRLLFVSESLLGERVGLVEIDSGIWSLYFNKLELGRHDERAGRPGTRYSERAAPLLDPPP
jgi:transposase InsO family protein